jgi:hypothetical protein
MSRLLYKMVSKAIKCIPRAAVAFIEIVSRNLANNLIHQLVEVAHACPIAAAFALL